MECEFEPTPRMEDTPEARIVEIDLPGYRREDVRVQVNNRGKLVISGERGAKEMGEITKVGGKSEKVQRGGNRFRKVIEVPQNLNVDSVSAKFRDARLCVSVPLLHVSEQQSQRTPPGCGIADRSLQSNVDRSSPAGQQDSGKENAAPAQDDHSARHPEAIRQGNDKEKPTVAAEKSIELLQEKNKDDEKCSSWRSETFPDLKGIPFPLNSSTSTFSNCGVLIASTVVLVSVGFYMTYKSRSSHHM